MCVYMIHDLKIISSYKIYMDIYDIIQATPSGLGV